MGWIVCSAHTTLQTGVQVLTSPLKGRPYLPTPVEGWEPPCPVDAAEDGTRLGTRPVAGFIV